MAWLIHAFLARAADTRLKFKRRRLMVSMPFISKEMGNVGIPSIVAGAAKQHLDATPASHVVYHNATIASKRRLLGPCSINLTRTSSIGTTVPASWSESSRGILIGPVGPTTSTG